MNNENDINIDLPTGLYIIPELEDIKRFMFAGNAMFTLESTRTGKWFTYVIVRREFKNEQSPENPNVKYFVSVLTGPDNTHSYTYMATIKPTELYMYCTAKSKIKEEATSFKALNFYLSQLKKNQLHPEINFYHKGVCGRCGRTLTTPDSVSNGLGPVCRGYMEPTVADVRRKKLQKLNLKLMKAEQKKAQTV